MNIYRELSFEEVYRYLCREFPEADRDFLKAFLALNFAGPYTVDTCYTVSREVEKIMYC